MEHQNIIDFYDVDFEVSYFRSDEENENEDEDEDENEDTYNYQTDLLKAFRMCEFNIDEILEKQDNLFVFFLQNQNLRDIIIFISHKKLTEDATIGFTELFSYQYFYLTHKLICQLYHCGTFDDDMVEKLCNTIKKNY